MEKLFFQNKNFRVKNQKNILKEMCDAGGITRNSIGNVRCARASPNCTICYFMPLCTSSKHIKFKINIYTSTHIRHTTSITDIQSDINA